MSKYPLFPRSLCGIFCLAVVNYYSAYCDEHPITLKLLNGTLTSYDSQTVIEYQSVLTWKLDNSQVEVELSRTKGPASFNPHWTLEAGFADKGNISVLRGNASGGMECWRFANSGSEWGLYSKAMLGSPPTDARGAFFTSLVDLTIKREKQEPDSFVITEQSRGGDPVYRSVIKNGAAFIPAGTWVGAETYAAQQKIDSNKSSEDTLRIQPQSVPMKQEVPTVRQLIPQLEDSVNSELTKTWLFWCGLFAVVIGVLSIYFSKKAK